MHSQSLDPSDPRLDSNADEQRESGLLRTLVDAWRLAVPYFKSDERRTAWFLLVAAVVLQLGVVAYTVAGNFWRNSFYESVQARDANEFIRHMGYFAALGVVFVICSSYQTYFSHSLQIRWRRRQSRDLVARWLDDSTHYRLSLGVAHGDNPDQRISEDVGSYVRLTLTLTVGLISNVASILSFVAILWGLSINAPLSSLGLDWGIPGYLVWMALLHAAAGTLIAHWIGRPLIPLEVQHERMEADYRSSLMRIRSSAEPVALLRGETWEARHLESRFTSIYRNTQDLMRHQRNLGFFSAGHRHVSAVVPYLVVGPLYFSGRVTFGALMQIGSAFVNVARAFSYFVTIYESLAELAAVVRRLQRLEDDLVRAKKNHCVALAALSEPGLRVSNLVVATPHTRGGHVEYLTYVSELHLAPGERLAVTGDPGAGKTSLMRMAAGLWPVAEGGRILSGFNRPAYVARESYVPPGSLLDVLAYPRPVEELSVTDANEVLHAVGLGHLLCPMCDIRDVGQARLMHLSAGEQQRLGIARALLAAPDVLWLDEALVSLPIHEASEIIQVIQRRLPDAAIVVLGHDVGSWFSQDASILNLRHRLPHTPRSIPEEGEFSLRSSAAGIEGKNGVLCPSSSHASTQ